MHLSTFCLFLSFKLSSLALTISLSLTHMHMHTHPLAHTGGCFLIVHTEKCPVRMSLSCKPDSAGCYIITTPAIHHPISQAHCCGCARVSVNMHDFFLSLRSETTAHRKDLFFLTRHKQLIQNQF